MTTDINYVYETLNNYMNKQIDVFDNTYEDSYVDYETDVHIDETLYNKDTFNYIVNNMCNYPNRLIEYDSSTLSIILIKNNYRFLIQGYSSYDDIDDDESCDEEDKEFVIAVEIKPY
jgi:hypothetical protein